MDNNIVLTDIDILNDVLNSEKAMVKNYAFVLTEASNDSLYNEFIKIYKDTNDAQRSLFNLMLDKGWYTVEQAQENAVVQKFQEYSNKKDELK